MVRKPAGIKQGETDGRSVGEIRRSFQEAAMGVSCQGEKSLPRPRKTITTKQFERY